MSQLREIVRRAQDLRYQNSRKYGVAGAKDGQPGYVRGGWNAAIADASADYRQQHGTQPAPKGPPKQGRASPATRKQVREAAAISRTIVKSLAPAVEGKRGIDARSTRSVAIREDALLALLVSSGLGRPNAPKGTHPPRQRGAARRAPVTVTVMSGRSNLPESDVVRARRLGLAPAGAGYGSYQNDDYDYYERKR